MNIRTLLSLVVALLIAGATALFVNNQLSNRRPAAQPVPVAVAAPPALPEVLVAKQAMPAGTFVKVDHLEWRPWPKEGLDEPYLVKGKFAEKELIGSVVRTHLHAGEPITKQRVVHPGEQGFLAAVLEPGQRAIAIPVDATTSVAGFVFPGDLVDVLFTLKRSVSEEGDEKPETRQFSQTLLTNVRVLAVDQTLDGEKGPAKIAKTATLQVTSDQAERIALAMSMGTLSLCLRSLGRPDTELASLGQASAGATGSSAPTATSGRTYTRDMDVLFMIGDPLGLPPPQALRRKVDVLRGSDAKQVRF